MFNDKSWELSLAYRITEIIKKITFFNFQKVYYNDFIWQILNVCFKFPWKWEDLSKYKEMSLFSSFI